MTYRTPPQAIRYCASHRDTDIGMCQKESRIAYNVPSDGTPTAAADWYGSDYPHQMPAVYTAKNFEKVPLGALLRWTGGRSGAGHVAPFRGLIAGTPYMWSTDLPTYGSRGLVPVALAEHQWGLRFVGWTEDIDGAHVVPPPAPPEPKPVPTTPSPTVAAGLKPVTYAAPKVRVFHDDTRIKTGGGVVSDSRVAAGLAAKRHYHRIDSDLHLTHANDEGLALGRRDHNMVPVNGHGAPHNPAYLKGKRYEEVSLESTQGMILFSATLRRNAAHGLYTEIEVKDLRGYADLAHLNDLFGDLRLYARAAYGKGWRKHVCVKVLSNLSGGETYALKILREAHDHGFKTMFLARGKWTYTRLPADTAEYVTWVRGARPGLYPKQP
jgi:hypothetical protein